jgi:hypothetical protein
MSPLRAARYGLTLGWRSLLKLRHSPDQLLDVLLPITFVLVFVFLFGKAVAGDWHAYLQFVLPGDRGAGADVRLHGHRAGAQRRPAHRHLRPPPQPADRPLGAADRAPAGRWTAHRVGPLLGPSADNGPSDTALRCLR